MEKRPLSKMAIASFVLSIASTIATLSIIILLPVLHIDMEDYIGFYPTAILFTTLLVLSISSGLAIIINILALRRIKRYNLRGKVLTIIGIVLSAIVISFYGWFLWTEVINRGGGCGNECSAAAALKLLTSAEATWFQQDCDGNGIKDYWTYDISCLHRMYRKDNTTKIAFIPIDMARADMASASMSGDINPFGTPKIESWAEIMTGSKSGYLFMAMVADEKGIPYNQNPVGPNKILATNNSKFAFIAYPDVYGISGINTFIVNEEGAIYARDMKSDKNKIILQWPNAIEMEKWRIAD